MASALIKKLKTVATGRQSKSSRGCCGQSWAALVAERNPQERGIGTLLVEAGEGGRGEREGGEGVGVLDSENKRRIRWETSLRVRMD